jgi:S1-C subfamily serine protease
LQAKYTEGSEQITNHGTAVAVDKHLLLTAYHNVTQGAFTIEQDGKWVDATLVRFDTNTDLALMRIKERVEPITLSESPALFISASAKSKPVADKRVSGIMEALIKADVQVGESGGAVLDARGRLVGIIVAVDGYEDSGRGRIVCLETIRAFLKAGDK